MTLGTPGDPIALTNDNLAHFIQKCAAALDEASVPTDNRRLMFQGKDGYLYELPIYPDIPQEERNYILSQMPDAMRRSLLELK